jgi:hypothetical protein
VTLAKSSGMLAASRHWERKRKGEKKWILPLSTAHLQLPERMEKPWWCQDFSAGNQFKISRFQNCKIKKYVLFEATKFIVICYNSNRKLIHPPFLPRFLEPLFYDLFSVFWIFNLFSRRFLLLAFKNTKGPQFKNKAY